MGRTLALDLGEKRTGAAVTDNLGITAQPVGFNERTGYKSDLAWVRKLMENYTIERIVIGYPLNMDGSAGEKAKACESIAHKFANDLNLKVVLFDERMTSIEAEKILIETGTSRKKRKKKIDQVSAQLILTGWLSTGGSGGIVIK
ncbi:MAG TPA: Holliday junction resolvase RuvX [Nitrospinota bacterium]|nr:Holliday junction resolvase RuvX [Nitrospinota bacterium]